MLLSPCAAGLSRLGQTGPSSHPRLEHVEHLGGIDTDLGPAQLGERLHATCAIQRAFIRYAFANREYEIQVNLLKDKWEVIEYQKGIPLQGSLDDVQEWLNTQEKISVYFMIEYVSGEEDLIGFADVYLKGRGVQILEQSSIVFDRDRMWHINQDKMFTKLQLKVGLVKGWDALEDDIYDL